jgi:predicted metal-dependent TIM-barrel fold hydrolase
MKYIDPHIHCVSRTTDDYLYMARAGVVAVSEPAFWAGFDRSSASASPTISAPDSTSSPSAPPATASTTIRWLCINAKEAENVELSREVIKLIPPLLNHPRVLGVGEIGLNKNTRNEITIFEEQVDLAAKHDQLILIHTPHLEDKHKGTSIIVDVLKNDRRIVPSASSSTIARNTRSASPATTASGPA